MTTLAIVLANAPRKSDHRNSAIIGSSAVMATRNQRPKAEILQAQANHLTIAPGRRCMASFMYLLFGEAIATLAPRTIPPSLDLARRRDVHLLIHEGGLLKGAVDDRRRIEFEPFVKDRRIDAAEVHVRVEVALNQVLRLQGRHLAVMTALDLLAEHKGDTAGTMVGSRTVVADAAAELGEQQHDHIVGVVMPAQVLHKGVDTFGHRGPQILVAGVLAGMGVKCAVVAVEDAATQISE